MFNETEFAAFAIPFFVKALGLTEEDVKEKAMSSDGQAELQTLYGTKRKEAKSEGYKEAEGKAQKTLNKLAKDQFGVDTDAKDLSSALSAIKDGYKPEGDTPDPVQLTEKQIKQHPLYLQKELALTNAEKALVDRNAEFDKAVDEKVNGKVTTLTLQQQAENALVELKAKIPTHAGQKDALLKEYRQAFEGVVPKNVDGKTYYYDREGNRLEDTMGAPLTWDSLSRQMAEKVFELEGPDRTSPGAKPANNSAAPSGGNVNLQPRTLDELAKVLSNNTIKFEDRTAATAFYEANGTDLG